MRRGWMLAWPMVALGCSTFSPEAREDGEGVGSNTNWFVACDLDSECGADLACLCGTCTKACTQDADCSGGERGTCPVDRGAYQAMCGVESEPAIGAVCVASCESHADCDGGACIGGGCAMLGLTPCEGMVSLELSASSSQLFAREGGLFGDRFYLPEWYSEVPPYEPTYEPSVLTVQITDSEHFPISGCEVALLTDETSGFGVPDSRTSNDLGEVHAVWVAGSAPTQRIHAAVRAESGELLTVSVFGEARSHAEPPSADSPASVNFTPPSAVVVIPPDLGPPEEVTFSFTPFTFPAHMRYVPFDTGALSVEFATDAVEFTPPESMTDEERLLQIVVAPANGIEGQLVWSSAGLSCVTANVGLRCTLFDGWEVGEAVQIRVVPRALAPAEIPSEYDQLVYSAEPCLGALGCTDYTISRVVGDAEENLAVVRYAGVDTMAERAVFITGIYGVDYGVAESCLLTETSHMLVRERIKLGGEWITTEGGYSYGYHDVWRNQICANYAANSTPEGYVILTGGSVLAPTPPVPGQVRDL